MSILDFTTGLFREPANLRSFVDDPDQALEDAGLPDATPEQVHDLLPVVAESMPPDHPLQAVVHSADPMRALAELHIDELVAIEEGEPTPADDYPDPREDEQQGDEHAHDYGVADLDISAIAWGKAIE
jgi:hypothetical protein